MSVGRTSRTVLLVLSAAGAAVVVSTLSAGTPARVVAGFALVFVAPWVAASHIPVIRHGDVDGGRLAGSGGLCLAAVVLVGLGLSASPLGLTTGTVTLGAIFITVSFAAVGFLADEPPPTRLSWPPLRFALLLVAFAMVIAAFVVARHAALAQDGREDSNTAFLIPGPRGLSLGVHNPKNAWQRFTVHIVEGAHSHNVRISVPPDGLTIIPRLRTIQSKATQHKLPGNQTDQSITIRVTPDNRGQRLSLYSNPLR